MLKKENRTVLLFKGKEDIRYKLTTLKLLFYMVYWKESRGTHLDKLMLYPLKLRMTKDMRVLLKKSERKYFGKI